MTTATANFKTNMVSNIPIVDMTSDTLTDSVWEYLNKNKWKMCGMGINSELIVSDKGIKGRLFFTKKAGKRTLERAYDCWFSFGDSAPVPDNLVIAHLPRPMTQEEMKKDEDPSE